MLSRFIAALHTNLGMTTEEIADTLWLAAQMKAQFEEKPAMPPSDPDDSNQRADQPPSAPLSPALDPEAPDWGGDIYHQPTSEKSMSLISGQLFRYPTAPALQHTLDIARALMPFMRRFPSETDFIFDEKATAKKIVEAHMRIWGPVCDPAPTAWFDVALVIDEGASMQFWRQTITELETLLRYHGAFRDVCTWWLATDQETVHLYAEADTGTKQRQPHKPEELFDPSGRRLILVVTDCISASWHSGKVQQLLDSWGQRNLVTLIQMLPYRLWRQTALINTECVRVYACVPATSNASLKMRESREMLQDDEFEPSLPIPVLTLEPAVLLPWAQIVMGASSTWISARVFNKSTTSYPDSTDRTGKTRLSARRLVRRFFNSAPLPARKLAGLLAVTPLFVSPELINLICATMVPDAEQIHVAEVLLGGLLEIDHGQSSDNSGHTAYKFVDGVRAELSQSVPLPDARKIIREISTYTIQHYDQARDIPAVISIPGIAPGTSSAVGQSHPFMRIDENALQELRSLPADSTVDPISQLVAEQPPAGKTDPLPQPVVKLSVPPRVTAGDRSLVSRRKSRSLSESLSLSVECFCPSCFTKINLGKCDIVSGSSGHVLKEAPKGPPASLIVEPLTGPLYTQEQAHRQCYVCMYLLPSNIERVPGVILSTVGDIFSGKSFYLASLIHQLKAGWRKNATSGYASFSCLTPDVERRYARDYLDPIFAHNQTLQSTLRTTLQKTPQSAKMVLEPLIYNLTVGLSAESEPESINLMIYDVAGEDFAPHKLVEAASFVLETSAFIFVVDPWTIDPILEQLPPHLQTILHRQVKSVEGLRAAIRLNDTIAQVEQYRKLKSGARFPDTPIAVMVSKSDLFKYVLPPEDYAFMTNPQYGSGVDLRDVNAVDQEVRELLRYYDQGDLLAATHRFRHVKFFATSATGEPPDEKGNFTGVKPRRCLDPLLWILYKLGVIGGSG